MAKIISCLCALLLVTIICCNLSDAVLYNTHQPLLIQCSTTSRILPDPSDCQKFIRCVDGTPFRFTCPPRTAFDPKLQVCAWGIGYKTACRQRSQPQQFDDGSFANDNRFTVSAAKSTPYVVNRIPEVAPEKTNDNNRGSQNSLQPQGIRKTIIVYDYGDSAEKGDLSLASPDVSDDESHLNVYVHTIVPFFTKRSQSSVENPSKNMNIISRVNSTEVNSFKILGDLEDKQTHFPSPTNATQSDIDSLIFDSKDMVHGMSGTMNQKHNISTHQEEQIDTNAIEQESQRYLHRDLEYTSQKESQSSQGIDMRMSTSNDILNLNKKILEDVTGGTRTKKQVFNRRLEHDRVKNRNRISKSDEWNISSATQGAKLNNLNNYTQGSVQLISKNMNTILYKRMMHFSTVSTSPPTEASDDTFASTLSTTDKTSEHPSDYFNESILNPQSNITIDTYRTSILSDNKKKTFSRSLGTQKIPLRSERTSLSKKSWNVGKIPYYTSMKTLNRKLGQIRFSNFLKHGFGNTVPTSPPSKLWYTRQTENLDHKFYQMKPTSAPSKLWYTRQTENLNDKLYQMTPSKHSQTDRRTPTAVNSRTFNHERIKTPRQKEGLSKKTDVLKRSLSSPEETMFEESPITPLSGSHLNPNVVNIQITPYMVTVVRHKRFKCPQPSGHFRDPIDCGIFYHCDRGIPYRRDCPKNQVFHQEVESCVASNLVPPCKHSGTYAWSIKGTSTSFDCPSLNGLFRDPVNCRRFFECEDGTAVHRNCLMGSVFDAERSKCSYSSTVPGCEYDGERRIITNVTNGAFKGSFSCPRDGFFRHPSACDIFYLCAEGQAVQKLCEPGTSFDTDLNMCVWSSLVRGCEGSKESEEFGDGRNNDGFLVPIEEVVDETPPEHYYEAIVREREFERGAMAVEGSTPHPFVCPQDHGLYADPYNCSMFIHCFEGKPYRHKCQIGTIYSHKTASCTWPHLADDCSATYHHHQDQNGINAAKTIPKTNDAVDDVNSIARTMKKGRKKNRQSQSGNKSNTRRDRVIRNTNYNKTNSDQNRVEATKNINNTKIRSSRDESITFGHTAVGYTVNNNGENNDYYRLEYYHNENNNGTNLLENNDDNNRGYDVIKNHYQNNVRTVKVEPETEFDQWNQYSEYPDDNKVHGNDERNDGLKRPQNNDKSYRNINNHNKNDDNNKNTYDGEHAYDVANNDNSLGQHKTNVDSNNINNSNDNGNNGDGDYAHGNVVENYYTNDPVKYSSDNKFNNNGNDNDNNEYTDNGDDMHENVVENYNDLMQDNNKNNDNYNHKMYNHIDTGDDNHGYVVENYNPVHFDNKNYKNYNYDNSKKNKKNIYNNEHNSKNSKNNKDNDTINQNSKQISVEIQDFRCPAAYVDGYYRDYYFCDIFHRCAFGTKFTFFCPSGTFFRLELNICDFWETVTDCTEGGLRHEAIELLPRGVISPVQSNQQMQVDAKEVNYQRKASPSIQQNNSTSKSSTDLSTHTISWSSEADIVDNIRYETNDHNSPVPCPAASGLFAHPRNCRQFMFCAQSMALVLTCPDSLVYNPHTLTCDFAEKVMCVRYDTIV